jgi:hypothetical protein
MVFAGTTDRDGEVSYTFKVSPSLPESRGDTCGHGGQPAAHDPRGRTGFDRIAGGSDCVSWLVGWPRKKPIKASIAEAQFSLAA